MASISRMGLYPLCGIRADDVLTPKVQKACYEKTDSHIEIESSRNKSLIALFFSVVTSVLTAPVFIQRIHQFEKYGRKYTIEVLDKSLSTAAKVYLFVGIVLFVTSLMGTLILVAVSIERQWALRKECQAQRERIRIIEAILREQQEDPFATLSPQQVEAFWNYYKINESIRSLWKFHSLAQIQPVWEKFESAHQETIQEVIKDTVSSRFQRTMEMIVDLKEVSMEKLENFFLSDEIISYAKTIPGSFEMLKWKLLSRTDENLRPLLFKIYYKLFDSKADLSKIGETAIQVKIVQKDEKGQVIAQEQLDQVDLQTLQLAAGGLFLGRSEESLKQNPQLLVTLGFDSPWSPAVMKRIIKDLIETKDVSLDWLLKNYEMLDIYGFKLHLDRLHSFVFDHYMHLSRHTTYTQAGIAELIGRFQPSAIGDIKSRWSKAEVNDKNFLLAMSYAKAYQLKELQQRCIEFISKIEESLELEYALALANELEDQESKETHQTKELEDQELVKACQKRQKELKEVLDDSFETLFEMPEAQISLIAQKSNFAKNVDWKQIGISNIEHPFLEQIYGLTKAEIIRQLVRTLDKMKTEPSVDPLLNSPGFIKLVQNCPVLFGFIQEILLKRTDQDFRTAVHHLHFKVFYPDKKLSERSEFVSFTIRKGTQATTLPKMPRAILDTAGESFKHTQLELNEKSPYSPEDVASVLVDYCKTKIFSFDELLKHYKLLNELKFDFLLERFHHLLFSNVNQKSLSRHSEPTFDVDQALAKCLFLSPPTSNESIQKLWTQIKALNPNNILIVMSLNAHFKIDSLKNKILGFIEGFVSSVYSRPYRTEEKLFKNIYEHAVLLKDQEILNACYKVEKRVKTFQFTLTGAWKVLELPPELRKVVFSND